MIRAKIIEIRNENFLSAIRKIANSSSYKNLKATFECGKLVKKVELSLKNADELVKESIEKNVVKDENGNPVIENNQYNILPEKISTFDQEHKEMQETCEIEIDFLPIDLEILEGVNLTPIELNAISFLIKG